MSFDDLQLSNNVSDEEWNYFLKNSEDGTIFSSLTYLNSCDIDYDLYWIKLKENIKAGLCLLINKESNSVINNDLIIYSGLIYNVFNKENKADILNQRFLISEFVSKQLPNLYSKVDLTFSPEILDPRAFQFYGYGTNKKKYKINTKFTSYIDTSSMQKTTDPLVSETFINIRPTKRRDIKRAISEGYNTRYTNDPDLFLNFYKENLLSQNEKVSENLLNRIKHLILELVEKEMAIIIEISDNCENDLYSVVYCWDHKKAYYLFGSGTNKNQKHWQGIAANWEAFKYVAKERGLKLIDLEGINSPERGKFKLSLGGKIIPYYSISLSNSCR